MTENILIPTDGSNQAEQAVDYGLTLAEAFGANVHALYVIETKASYILTVELGDEKMEKHKEYGEEVVNDVIEQASERGLDGVGVVKTGRIPREIVDYARDNDIDAIIMGKQGQGAVGKYVGGTAEKVMRMSGIPVTVIGPGSD